MPPRRPFLLLFSLLLGAPAMGEPLDVLARHPLPEPARHLSALPDGSGIVVVSRGGTRLMDAHSGRTSGVIAPGGRAAQVLDLDGLGGLEVLVCGEDGLYWAQHTEQGWSPPERLDRTPCQDLVPNGDRVLVVGASPRWLSRTRLLSEPIAVLRDKGKVLGVADGEDWLVGTVGTRLLIGPEGETRLDPPLGGLALTSQGIAWSQTRDDQVVWGDRVLETGPAPEGLTVLHAGAQETLLVSHPNALELGWFDADGVEQRVGLDFAARTLLPWDYDGDGCTDVLTADQDELLVLSGPCGAAPVVAEVDENSTALDPWSAPPEAPPPPEKRIKPRPERTRKEIPRQQGRKLGPFRLPVLAGYTHTGPAPDRFAMRSVRLSTGFTMLRPFRSAASAFPLQTSPNLTLMVESGTWNVRLYAGASTAPFSIGIDNATGVPYWHLLVGRLGVTWGNDRLRVGVHGNLGLVAAGVGVRVVVEHIQFRRVRMGFDLYLDVMAQGVAEAGLLWGWTFPRAGDAPQGERWRDGTPGCRRVTLGLGAGVTVYNTRFSWEYVGTDVNAAVTGGPALVGSCEAGGTGSVRPWLGISTSPWSTWAGPGDQSLAHLGTLDGGVLFGGPSFAAGLHASAGVMMIGGGARVLWLPFHGEQGARAGFELRGTLLWPSSPAGEVMLLGTMAWDPRPVRVAARKEHRKER